MGRVPMRLSILMMLMAQLCAAVAPVGAAAAADERAIDGVLQQAIELSLDAEFERSLALFDQLLSGAALDQRRLVLLLSERSMVLYALGKQEALEDDLRRLARVAPDTTLSERAPPQLVTRWQAIAASARQEELRLRAEAQASSAADTEPVSTQELQHGVPMPLAPVPEESRKKRALLIGGAVLTAAATLVVALVLTVPSSSPADRTSVNPSVEF